jgi:hypothetical protein
VELILYLLVSFGKFIFHVDGSSVFPRNSGAYPSDYTQLHSVTEVGAVCSALICAKLMECLKWLFYVHILQKHQNKGKNTYLCLLLLLLLLLLVLCQNHIFSHAHLFYNNFLKILNRHILRERNLQLNYF